MNQYAVVADCRSLGFESATTFVHAVMKKKYIGIVIVLVSLCSLSGQSQGFNYETKATIEWRGTGKVCIVTTCTGTQGDNCDTPGSAFRDCFELFY